MLETAGIGRIAAGVGVVVASMAATGWWGRDPASTRDLERIRAIYREVLEDVPRPTGSVASARAIERIERALAAIGVTSERHRRLSCAPNGMCADVTSVLARIGAATGPALLLAAHHDTVAASPGALDDGVGVVTLLEIARELTAEPLPSGSVILMFSDGEELGLNGARAFLEAHRWQGDVASMVAVEAMGGPTVFDYGASSRHMVRALHAAKLSPLSTTANAFRGSGGASDAIVFAERGMPSAVIGGIGDVRRYHTPLDTSDRLDLHLVAARTDFMLAWTRALAARPPASPEERTAEVVTFTLPITGPLSWPKWANPILAVLVAVLALLAARKHAAGLPVARPVVVVAVATVLGALAAIGVLMAMRGAGLLFGPWPDAPWAARALPVALGLALSWARDGREAWIGSICTLALAGLAAVIWMPSATPHALVPAAVGAMIALSPLPEPRGRAIATFASLALCAAMIAVLYDFAAVLNAGASYVTQSILHALLVPALAPLVHGRRLIALGAAVACAAALAIAPRIGEPPLQQTTVWLHQDTDLRSARWMIQGSAPPEPMARAVPLSRQPDPFAWWPQAAVYAGSSTVALYDPPPELTGGSTVTADGRVSWMGRLRSPRGAWQVSMVLPKDIGEVKIAGEPATLAPGAIDRARGHRLYSIYGVGPDGVTVQIGGKLGGPKNVEIFDFHPGLPANARGLVHRRPPSSQPAHAGDGTMISRKLIIDD